MKLLYIENALAIYGGIERVLTDKLNWLVEYGECDVCLLIANQGGNPIVFPLNHKIKYHDLGIMFHQVYRYPRWRRCFLLYHLHQLFRQRIAEMIELFSPDVIVCTRLDHIYDVVKVRGSIPVVFESHNSYLAYKFEKYTWLQKLQIKFWHRALKKTQMIISLSQGDALEWKKINPNVHVIPNVVHLNDTGRYSDCCFKSAIFVGRYSYQKDIHSLLKVWELVHQRHQDWQLHVFGGYGSLQDELQYEMNRMGSNIVIHQPTTNIYEEYMKSSLLLMTSRFEPFGLVLPEAMSCGIPVVAFDCPYGPADIISDGVDGFLIKDRDIALFADRVCSLIESPALRMKMGQSAIDSSTRFSPENIMPQWESLFQKLVATKTR